MKKINSKLVFITGGSSGIGLAAAEQFLKQGARVCLIARDSSRLEKAAGELKLSGAAENRIAVCSLDVSDNPKTLATLSELMKTLGVPDIMLTCAGIARPDYFENTDYGNFRRTISTNLEGVWNVLSAVVPEMKKRGGHIITTSSVAGFVGTFGYTAYSASKFGIIGLSETLRSELKPHNILVSVLCPPDTDTPGFAEENKTKPPETIAVSGNVKLMKPEDVAKTLIKGIKRNKFLIIPGFMGKLTFILKSIFPKLVFAIMDGDVRKTHQREN